MVNNIEARLHGHRSVKGIQCIMSFAICNPIASKSPCSLHKYCHGAGEPYDVDQLAVADPERFQGFHGTPLSAKKTHHIFLQWLCS